MKTYVTNRFLLLFCAVALGIGSSFGLAAATGREVGSVERGALERQGVEPSPHSPRSDATRLAWSQIGAKAGADYRGDGLAVSPTAEGARLRCVFQRLEGEATREGLWLTSTLTNAVNDRFRIVAAEVGRRSLSPSDGERAGERGSFIGSLSSNARIHPAPANERESRRRNGLLSPTLSSKGGEGEDALANTGAVSIAGQTVRFTRPGLVEEYSVSMDGVRQDFIIEHPPLNPQLLAASERSADGPTLNPRPGELAVRLAVSGARVELAVGGAQLVLENSGRRIAYSRLRVTDATGKELTARMEVIGRGESQRDSITQPRVASPGATLGSGEERADNPERVASDGRPRYDQQCDATPLGLEIISRSTPRVARLTRNPGLRDAIPSGLSANTTERQAKTQPDERAPMLVVVNDAEAVYPVRIDPTFSDANWISMGGLPGADGSVEAAVVDGSGNLYIGGNFTVVGDVIANGIAKWNGSSWSALGSGLGGAVVALAVAGSDLYAGGYFTMAGGSVGNYIAKWNGSGWSALGSGMNNYVSALAVSGGDLYAGGGFTMAGGSAATNIAKWNGSGWSALGSGISADPGYPYGGGDVSVLAVSGSDLYAGGWFTNAGGIAAANIAKWNGSSWSALDSGISGPPEPPYSGGSVYALAVSGSDLYVGGYFTTAGGSAAASVAKWNGSSWSALGSGMGGPYASVFALAVSGSDLYAGGGFTTAGGSAANYIAKWNGSSWSALGSGMNNQMYALAVSGSELYAGGDFTMAGGSAANKIAKWNGSSWSALGSGMNSYVYALAVSGSDLYAGGDFATAGGTAANSIAKWNGSSWSALGSGMAGGGSYTYVYALAVSGSNLYAGGDFTTAGGSAANYVAKWDGSSWSALSSGMGGGPGGSYVEALAVSGSDLYAGGQFRTAGGTAANSIAKWNGSGWSALGSGVVGQVYALAVSGSNVYAGGYLLGAGGGGANNIAKWNGSSWSALGSGVGGSLPYVYVSALAVSGRDLYVGGNFTTAGGNAANYVAKWNGSSWSALGSGMNNGVSALAVSGSNVYAGGVFTMAGGITANYIAKWNGTNWSALGSGMGGGFPYVYALAVSGSDLYAGGGFTTAGGKVSAFVARAIVNPPVLAIQGDGDGGYFIRFSGVPGSAYRLERAPGLSGPWAASSPQTAPASGLVEFWDLFPPPGQGFYRSVGP